MPQRLKPPRLWLRPAQRNKLGAVTRPEFYVILDNGRQISTGTDDMAAAEKALGKHIAAKHAKAITSGKRDTSAVLVADVINLYVRNVAHQHANVAATKRHLTRVFEFFGEKTLADINGELCRSYARQSQSQTTARRDLELLKAAIGHHMNEGLHDKVVSVVLPAKRPPRERWLDRSEAAALLWACWRNPYHKHVARFILLALYTGRRCAVVSAASFRKEPGHPWIDLRAGFLRPPEGAKITKKRNPTIPLPGKLLIHLRAWHRNGADYAVPWGAHSVGRVGPTMKKIAIGIGLGDKVTPHALRHTAATWMMQAGVDLWEAAGYLGMTVQTLESVYGHHRPQHLAGARDAFAKMPRLSTVRNVSREQRSNKTTQKDAKNIAISQEPA
jgi:integrase